MAELLSPKTVKIDVTYWTLENKIEEKIQFLSLNSTFCGIVIMSKA